MKLDKTLLDNLLEQAAESPRLRMNYDLRTSSEDNSQRMLNALLPGTVLPIHRHTKTTETLVVLCGRMEEIFYEEASESDKAGIEARPLWKPMHKQPVYTGCDVYTNDVEVELFKTGLCLPSGPCVSDEDVAYIVESIKEAIS